MGESWACRCKPGLYSIVKGSLLAAEIPNITVPLGSTGLKLECGQAGAFSSAEAAVSLGSQLSSLFLLSLALTIGPPTNTGHSLLLETAD